MRIDIKKAMYCLLCLTFLNDSSADVCNLKLNENIVNTLKHYREVWVDKNSGDIFSGRINHSTYMFPNGFHYRPHNGNIVHIVNICRCNFL